MTPRTADVPASHDATQPRHLAVLILSLALSMAAGDTWVALNTYPGDSPPLSLVIRSTLAVLAGGIVLLTVLGIGAAIAARLVGGQPARGAKAAIVGSSLLFLLLLPFDGLQFQVYRQGSLPAFGALALATLTATAVMAKTYRTAKPGTQLCAVLPVVLLAGAAWQWSVLPDSNPVPVDPAVTPAPQPSQHTVGRVILVTIDSLRRDELGCYSPGRDLTPRLDAFAQEGIRFTRAYAPAPWTLPSVASIMTGLAPFTHGVVTMSNRLPDESVTFAERMLQAGYDTGGIGYNIHLTESKGMQQGFTHYDFYPKSVPPELRSAGTRLLRRAGLIHKTRRGASTTELTNLAAAWTRAHSDRDFFLWLHYYDPHSPYAPPPEYRPDDALVQRFGPEFIDKGLARDGTFGRTIEERGWIRALYEAEVRYTDHEFGRFLDALKANGLYDDSLIVVTIDHGEEFWDHGGFEHGHTLYNELLAAPLIVKMPRAISGADCDSLASLGGIMPTVLDLCGVAYDADSLTYRSFAPALRDGGAAFDGGALVSSGVHRYDNLESVVWGDYKYIRSTLSDHEQLFDLREDPRERHSLVTLDAIHLEEGRRLLEGFHRKSTALPSAPAALPEDLHRELETLGYL